MFRCSKCNAAISSDEEKCPSCGFVFGNIVGTGPANVVGDAPMLSVQELGIGGVLWLLAIEAAAVVVVGVAISALLYSHAFQECCRESVGAAIGVLLLPAGFIAMIIGNGVHSATPVHFTIGLILELLVVWWLLRLMWRFVSRLRQQDGA